VPVISACGRQKQEECEFEVSMDVTVRPCLKKPKKKKNKGGFHGSEQGTGELIELGNCNRTYRRNLTLELKSTLPKRMLSCVTQFSCFHVVFMVNSWKGWRV
jgi:hypothetical protein